MTEIDVTLTDYALALECLLFVVVLHCRQTTPDGLRLWFSAFFASVGIASFCGGTVHGYFSGEQTLAFAYLWTITLLAMGVTAFSAWAIGARLLFSKPIAKWAIIASSAQFIAYSIALFFRKKEFWFAVLDNLPAILFLIVAIAAAYWREKHRDLILAAVGLVLALVAALLQQLRVGIHPDVFNHNALYHVLQGIALWLFFLGVQSLGGTESAGSGSNPLSDYTSAALRVPGPTDH